MPPALSKVSSAAAKLALVHLVESGLLFGVLNPLHVLQDRRAVGLAQGFEHAATFDTGKLRVVAGKNEFRAGLYGRRK